MKKQNKKYKELVVVFSILIFVVFIILLVIKFSDRIKNDNFTNSDGKLNDEKVRLDIQKNDNDVSKKETEVKNKNKENKSNKNNNDITEKSKQETSSKNETKNENETNIEVKQIKLNVSELNMYVGKTKTIVADLIPSDATVREIKWYSKNNNVAIVEDGKVTAVSPGQTEIVVKVKNSNVEAKCKVKVEYEPISVKSDIHLEKRCRRGIGTLCYRYIVATIIPEGGNNDFVEYSLQLYNNGIRGESSNHNTLTTNSYSYGEFYVLYEVKDSAGNYKKGFTNIYNIDENTEPVLIMEN